MKRLFKNLFIFLIILLPFNISAVTEKNINDVNYNDVIRVSSGEYDLVIDDRANLLTEGEKIQLQDDMFKLLKFGNIAFVSNDTEIGDIADLASGYYFDNFEIESGTVFYIDMESRYIYIYSYGENSKVITNMKANVITDNVYTYASNKEFYLCAQVAYNQMYTILIGGNISEPLRYLCSAVLALITSFMVCFTYAYFTSRKKKASVKEISSAILSKLVVNNFVARITGEDRVYNPPSSSSSSGGSSRGGGGGRSRSGGSGGGHRF